ncbi:MAG: magnesium-translocating P-type ATPase [Nitrosospira multiformis]|nr:magnesium-translocating P-type ATPase [Nitrosospira multiformis]
MFVDTKLRPWWLEPGLEEEAGLDARKGLSTAEAKSRLACFGPNLLRETREKSLPLQFIARFRNPLIIILLAASTVSALTGDVSSFFIINFMILLSVTLDFVQEYRANESVKKLRRSVSLRATVVRDDKPLELPVSEIVPGDVVLLFAGDLVPGDGFVLESRDFFVNQALLTGEPYPVEKRPGLLPESATGLEDASNAVFMGTSVISGSARITVVNTGSRTAIGAIADSLSRPAEPTSFELGIHRFGALIMRLTILMVMFVLLTNVFFHKPWLESFLFAVALAVGLTPELLPMVISVTLSRGALRMARMQIIVKRLSAIQDLGSVDVLCTDKTGTLTEAKIRLEKHVDVNGCSSERVLELAYLNSFFETGMRSPLDQAILDHEHIEVGTWRKIDEVPFDFERRRISVLIDNGMTRWLVVKGAADEILQLCSHYEAGGKDAQRSMNEAAMEEIHKQYRVLEEEGFRVLGIAWREVSPDYFHELVHDEANLILAGFAAFLDPPKVSAAPALAALAHAGVTIKIVTGDSELVTRYICKELKIEVSGLLTGKDIAELDDHALQARVESANIFCRVNPTQKERVIRALKARNHVVGYLGDGINDAPSLHTADVGLSVDSAVDVAREAADMILLKHDLDVLYLAVMEGRRTLGNIMKYIMMGTSSNFGNMFSMAGAALFLPFLPMLPTQILLNNILYDISEVPIPLDKVDTREMQHPHVLDLDLIRNFMLVLGPISSLFDFIIFYIMLVVLNAGEKLFQTGWFIESLCTQVLVIFVIRTRGNPLRSTAHPLLIITSLTIIAVAALLPLTPVGVYFGFVPPPIEFYLILGAMVVLYLTLAELAKQGFYRWVEQADPKKKRARDIVG